jgi:hypothetical protein
MRQVHSDSRGTYGARWVHADLVRQAAGQRTSPTGLSATSGLLMGGEDEDVQRPLPDLSERDPAGLPFMR